MMKTFRTLLLLVSFLMVVSPAEARMGGGGMGGGGMGGGGMGGFGSFGGVDVPSFAGADGQRYDSFESTGLSAAFPDGFSCASAVSSFGAPASSDGIDLNITEGTPLLAMAAGDVIAKGEGGKSEGNYLWLRFAPGDTGLPFWTFAKYQHLSVVPSIEIGTRVKAGEIIALSGSSVSALEHRDNAVTHPHFHLATTYGSSSEFKLGGRYGSIVKGQGAKLDDPMIIYVGKITKPEDAHGMPIERRQIAVSVVGQDGAVYPPASKTVWPVACHR